MLCISIKWAALWRTFFFTFDLLPLILKVSLAFLESLIELLNVNVVLQRVYLGSKSVQLFFIHLETQLLLKCILKFIFFFFDRR